MIIAVGFKVNSERAVQFGKWVKSITAKYTIKGFSDEQRSILKNSFKECKQKIKDEIALKRRNENIEPLLKSVRLIPLSEMAFLTENLVDHNKITSIT